MGENLTVNMEIRYERRLQSLILNRGIRTTAQVIEILPLLNGFVERIYTYVIGSALPNQAHRLISHPKSLWKTKFHVESQGLADYFLSNSYELLSLKLSLGKVFQNFHLETTAEDAALSNPYVVEMRVFWWKQFIDRWGDLWKTKRTLWKSDRPLWKDSPNQTRTF